MASRRQARRLEGDSEPTMARSTACRRRREDSRFEGAPAGASRIKTDIPFRPVRAQIEGLLSRVSAPPPPDMSLASSWTEGRRDAYAHDWRAHFHGAAICRISTLAVRSQDQPRRAPGDSARAGRSGSGPSGIEADHRKPEPSQKKKRKQEKKRKKKRNTAVHSTYAASTPRDRSKQSSRCSRTHGSGA